MNAAVVQVITHKALVTVIVFVQVEKNAASL